MKGESRSRVKSNDDLRYVIITGIWPGPLRTAGGFKPFSLLFLFLDIEMGFDKMNH